MDDVSLLKLRQKSSLKGEYEVNLPTSKSISNRLLVIRALSSGKIELQGLSVADDTRFLAAALEEKSEEIYMGDGGTTMRFGLAWACVTPGTRILRGSSHLQERPIAQLVDALRKLGADIEYLEQDSRPPLRVRGKKLKGGSLKLEGSTSSQFISALLLVAPYFDDGFSLELASDQVSVPYIQMTYALMKEAGAEIEWKDGAISTQPKPYQANKVIHVEPDWSGASYFYSWVALNPKLIIRIPGLKEQSVQGDRACARVYEAFGINTHFDAKGVIISNRVEDFALSPELNCINFPDLAQTIAVSAGALNQAIKLTGLQTLRIKETDRIDALHNELAKCRIPTKAGRDYLEILSSQNRLKKLSEVSIRTYNDHRMAMSFAPMVGKLNSLVIENPEVVTKSFPNYWGEVQKIGVELLRI